MMQFTSFFKDEIYDFIKANSLSLLEIYLFIQLFNSTKIILTPLNNKGTSIIVIFITSLSIYLTGSEKIADIEKQKITWI